MPMSDADIVARCLAGEEEAFRLLVERFDHPVYVLIHRMISSDEDARDLTQETFVKAFRALEQFDQKRNFSSWLYKIASNQTIDFLRKKKLQTTTIDGDPDRDDRPALDLVDEKPRPDQLVDEGFRREKLTDMVRDLAPHYRVVVELRYQKQLSYDEITEVLDLPLGTVKARLHRAHHQLRAWMEGETLEEDMWIG